jgi:menaquinol-cytochrome c reductase iron-sulfur subunit
MSSEPTGSTPPPSPPSDPSPPPATDRREFVKTAACYALGGACVLAPVAAGITVLLSPLSKPSQDGTWVQLTKLTLLPAGSPPRLFQVLVERSDAWTRHQQSAIGSVYLERISESEVRAFHASCPHLGCAVEWRTEGTKYYCPCHDSSFTKDGSIIQPSPAARGLDTLAVEIRGEGEVWVRFQDFKAGIKEKIAVA